MTDDLGLGVPPLTMDDVTAPGGPAGGGGQAAPGQPKPDTRKDWLRLALMLPLVMKGGPGALQGFLTGMNQSDQRGREDAVRQQAFDAEQRQAAETRQYQQDTLDQRYAAEAARQQEQRDVFMQTMLKNYATDIGNTEDEAGFRAVQAAYEEQAARVGYPISKLQAIGMEMQTPARLQRKAAMGVIDRLKTLYGQDKWEAMARQFTHTVGTQARVSGDDLLRMAGLDRDPNAPPVVSSGGDLDKSSLDVQAADALRRGDTDEFDRLVRVKQALGTADDRPADTVGQELRHDLIRMQIAAAEQRDTDTKRVDQLAREAAFQTTEDTLGLIRKLATIGTDGTLTLHSATRNLFGARMPFGRNMPGSATAVAGAALNRLRGRAILDLISEMKSQSRTGATGFGAMNREELRLLENSATMLNSSNISDAAAATELQRIYDIVIRAQSAAMRGGGGVSAPVSGGVSVQAPNGSVYTFQTQEAADAFKAEAGIK